MGGSLSPPEGNVQLSCTVPHRGPRCVSLMRDRMLPRVPDEGTGTRGDTATPSVLQEVDEAGWEDTGAGAVTLDEADLGVPKWGSEGQKSHFGQGRSFRADVPVPKWTQRGKATVTCQAQMGQGTPIHVPQKHPAPSGRELWEKGTRVGTPTSVGVPLALTQLCSSSSRVTTITSPLEKVSSRALSPLQSATAFTRFCLPLA